MNLWRGDRGVLEYGEVIGGYCDPKSEKGGGLNYLNRNLFVRSFNPENSTNGKNPGDTGIPACAKNTLIFGVFYFVLYFNKLPYILKTS